MDTIKIAVVGLGNCASSLLQGIVYYRDKLPADAVGLMHWEIGGYTPSDIEVVAAFDIDERKVGYDVHEAIFAAPNCTTVFCNTMPKCGVTVSMGRVLDGVSEHMEEYDVARRFVVSKQTQPTAEAVVAQLQAANADMVLNYLPVGSEQATEFYAQCALDAGVAFVNNIPVFYR